MKCPRSEIPGLHTGPGEQKICGFYCEKIQRMFTFI